MYTQSLFVCRLYAFGPSSSSGTLRKRVFFSLSYVFAGIPVPAGYARAETRSGVILSIRMLKKKASAYHIGLLERFCAVVSPLSGRLVSVTFANRPRQTGGGRRRRCWCGRWLVQALQARDSLHSACLWTDVVGDRLPAGGGPSLRVGKRSADDLEEEGVWPMGNS
jgi:hypothetical protein